MSTIQDLEELILKNKEEKEPFDNRISVINKRSTRALRDEENYITKVGEFEYTDGSPVKANTPYHIHYTSTTMYHQNHIHHVPPALPPPHSTMYHRHVPPYKINISPPSSPPHTTIYNHLIP